MKRLKRVLLVAALAVLFMAAMPSVASAQSSCQATCSQTYDANIANLVTEYNSCVQHGEWGCSAMYYINAGTEWLIYVGCSGECPLIIIKNENGNTPPWADKPKNTGVFAWIQMLERRVVVELSAV